MAAAACWISWLIRENSCDCNSGWNETLEVKAESGMAGRTAYVEIIGYISPSHLQNSISLLTLVQLRQQRLQDEYVAFAMLLHMAKFSDVWEVPVIIQTTCN